MSNARSYQPALIVDLVANPQPGQVALTTLAASVLPDGCEAFALSNRTLYRLDKASTDAALGGAAAGIVAAAGGGNWIPQSPKQGSIGVQNFIDLTVALTGSANFLPLVGSFANILSGGEWDLNTSSGIATWKGPSNQRFLLNVSASMYNTTSVRETILGVSVDSSAAIPSSRQIKGTSPVDTGSDALFELSLATILELDQNQTVEIMLAGQTTSLTLTNLIYTLTPLG